MKKVYTCFCTDFIHEGHLNIIKEAQKSYQTTAHDQEVRNLKRVKYRTHLRQAFNDFADTMKRKY